MRVSLCTLGCKLNQAETEELKKTLIAKGFSVVPFKEHADIAIVRACAVTANASQTTRGLIRRAKRRGAYVIAGGCLENRDLPEIDFWARDEGEIEKRIIALRGERHAELVSASLPASKKILKQVQDDKREGALSQDNSISVANRTRAMIKIQTGCNFNCAYCVVPHFRGKSKSVPSEKIIQDIKEAEKNGYKEIVLTGVNICQHQDPLLISPLLRGRQNDGGLPLNPPLGKRGRKNNSGAPSAIGLADLLKKILRETKIERIRLGSLDPRLIGDDLIKLFTDKLDSPSFPLFTRGGHKRESTHLIKSGKNSIRLMPHWHLSLQSGSDSILQKMNRGYTTKKYLAIVKKLRRANPLFSFTTDIIVGFLGETEKEFLATVAFVKKIGFSKVHIFPFSPRPNTPAQKMTGQIQDKIKTERVMRLKKICEQVATDFAKKFISKTRPVLFEPYTKKVQGKNKKSGLWAGYTPEYLRVALRSKKNLRNQIKKIKIGKDSSLRSE